MRGLRKINGLLATASVLITLALALEDSKAIGPGLRRSNSTSIDDANIFNDPRRSGDATDDDDDDVSSFSPDSEQDSSREPQGECVDLYRKTGDSKPTSSRLTKDVKDIFYAIQSDYDPEKRERIRRLALMMSLCSLATPKKGKEQNAISSMVMVIKDVVPNIDKDLNKAITNCNSRWFAKRRQSCIDSLFPFPKVDSNPNDLSLRYNVNSPYGRVVVFKDSEKGDYFVTFPDLHRYSPHNTHEVITYSGFNYSKMFTDIFKHDRYKGETSLSCDTHHYSESFQKNATPLTAKSNRSAVRGQVNSKEIEAHPHFFSTNDKDKLGPQDSTIGATETNFAQPTMPKIYVNPKDKSYTIHTPYSDETLSTFMRKVDSRHFTPMATHPKAACLLIEELYNIHANNRAHRNITPQSINLNLRDSKSTGAKAITHAHLAGNTSITSNGNNHLTIYPGFEEYFDPRPIYDGNCAGNGKVYSKNKNANIKYAQDADVYALGMVLLNLYVYPTATPKQKQEIHQITQIAKILGEQCAKKVKMSPQYLQRMLAKFAVHQQNLHDYSGPDKQSELTHAIIRMLRPHNNQFHSGDHLAVVKSDYEISDSADEKRLRLADLRAYLFEEGGACSNNPDAPHPRRSSARRDRGASLDSLTQATTKHPHGKRIEKFFTKEKKQKHRSVADTSVAAHKPASPEKAVYAITNFAPELYTLGNSNAKIVLLTKGGMEGTFYYQIPNDPKWYDGYSRQVVNNPALQKELQSFLTKSTASAAASAASNPNQAPSYFAPTINHSFPAIFTHDQASHFRLNRFFTQNALRKWIDENGAQVTDPMQIELDKIADEHTKK
ncbi:MAG: hypothetical protein HQK52_14950 [Oligoflexia bacterium]|nr:hypothetical protein [Oligoflexia bacterium]